MKKKNKISKTAQKKKDRDINNKLLKKFEEQELEKERKREDLKDNIDDVESKNFEDSGSINDLMKALKDSGISTEHDIFADMERQLNNNEAIKELVDIKNIRMKTKVTDSQHKIIVILYGAYHTLKSRYKINFIGLERILNEFIEIAPSIEGKRAEQFVSAHQANAQNMANAKLAQGNQIREQSEFKS